MTAQRYQGVLLSPYQAPSLRCLRIKPRWAFHHATPPTVTSWSAWAIPGHRQCIFNLIISTRCGHAGAGAGAAAGAADGLTAGAPVGQGSAQPAAAACHAAAGSGAGGAPAEWQLLGRLGAHWAARHGGGSGVCHCGGLHCECVHGACVRVCVGWTQHCHFDKEGLLAFLLDRQEVALTGKLCVTHHASHRLRGHSGTQVFD